MERLTSEELKSLIKDSVRELLYEEGILKVKEEEIIEEPSPIDQPLSSLGFRRSIISSLGYADIYTIRDLISYRVEEVRRIRNIGKATLVEIILKLNEHGYELNREQYPSYED